MGATAKVVVEALNRRRRLAELGLREEELTDSLVIAASAQAFCTDDHPPIYPALSFWAEGVAALRSKKHRDGWTRSDARNYSTVVNKERTLQIAIARGNRWTAIEHIPSGQILTTSHPKGPLTESAIKVNSQQLTMVFDDVADVINDAAASSDPITTWVFLHYRVGNKIRCELSQPMAINKSGFVEEWHERIILPEIELTGKVTSGSQDKPVQRDVKIRRKA